MKQKLCLLFICLGISTFSMAQSQKISPDILSPAGGVSQASSMEVDWTLGEFAVGSLNAGDAMYTEGYHQPVLNMQRLTDVTHLNNQYSISVFPNPVNSLLTVNVQSSIDSKLILNLMDVNGKILSVESARSKNDSKIFDLSGFANGLYLLNIKNNSGSVIESYKISKIQ